MAVVPKYMPYKFIAPAGVKIVNGPPRRFTRANRSWRGSVFASVVVVVDDDNVVVVASVVASGVASEDGDPS